MLRRLAMVGGRSSISPAASRASASCGPDPDGGDGLAVVVAGHLAERRRGDEEPGVVAPWRQLGGDPVAHVVDGVDDQHQVLRPADVEEAHALPVDGDPGRRRNATDLSRVAGVEERTGPRSDPGRSGHQHAGLFEALAQGGDPEARPPDSTPRMALASASVSPWQWASTSGACRRGRPSPRGRRRRRRRTPRPGFAAACTPRPWVPPPSRPSRIIITVAASRAVALIGQATAAPATGRSAAAPLGRSAAGVRAPESTSALMASSPKAVGSAMSQAWAPSTTTPSTPAA